MGRTLGRDMYTCTCYPEERLGNLGAKPHFLPFSFGRTTPPPRLETALSYKISAIFTTYRTGESEEEFEHPESIFCYNWMSAYYIQKSPQRFPPSFQKFCRVCCKIIWEYNSTKQQQWMGHKKYQEYVDSFQAIYVRLSLICEVTEGCDHRIVYTLTSWACNNMDKTKDTDIHVHYAVSN